MTHMNDTSLPRPRPTARFADPRWFGLGLALLGIVAAGPVQAEGLGLLEAYEHALDSDPELAAAREARAAGRERIVQGRAELLPKINLQASYMEHDSESYSLFTQGTNAQDYGAQTYAIELRQPLFRLESLAAYRAGKAETERVKHVYSQAEQAFILRVARRYFAVLSASEALEAARAEREAMEQRMEAARQGREVGISSRTEYEEAVARRDQAESTLITAENDYELARQELAILLGFMPEELRRIEGVPGARPLEPADVDAWVERAIANAPALAEARESVNLARAEVTRRQGDRLPSIDLVARYSDQDGGPQGGDDYFAEDTVYGVELSMPLFGGGALASRVSEARSSASEAEQRLEQSRRATTLETRRGFLNARAARSRLEATERALESASTAREATRRGYRNGLNSQVELLDAEQRFFAVQRDLARTKYAYLESLLNLKAAVGELAEEDLAGLAPLFNADLDMTETP